MATEAQQMWDAAIAAARACFNDPRVKAMYAAEAKRNAERFRREEAEAKAKRDAVEAEKQRSRSYDIWALNGGSDECTQFGIRDGCKPWCPVFESGQCVMQAENEEIFASPSAAPAHREYVGSKA